MNWANMGASTKTPPVWIWQKKSRSANRAGRHRTGNQSLAPTRRHRSCSPTIVCHRSRARSTLSWTGRCRSGNWQKRTPSVLTGVMISRKRKSKKLSPSICQKMGISSLYGSPGTGKTTPYRQPQFGPQAEPRKSDHVPASFGTMVWHL